MLKKKAFSARVKPLALAQLHYLKSEGEIETFPIFLEDMAQMMMEMFAEETNQLVDTLNRIAIENYMQELKPQDKDQVIDNKELLKRMKIENDKYLNDENFDVMEQERRDRQLRYEAAKEMNDDELWQAMLDGKL